MSCIVYQVDKKTGAKYAYKSESYWDKEKQQPRSKRTYIGKVDPETGEIITKEKRGSHSDSRKNDVSEELTKLYKEIKEKDDVIAELREELKAERKRVSKLENTIQKIRSLAEV